MKKQRKTIVMITHRSSALAVSNKLLLLVDGTVQLFGPTTNVMKTIAQKNKENQPIQLFKIFDIYMDEISTGKIIPQPIHTYPFISRNVGDISRSSVMQDFFTTMKMKRINQENKSITIGIGLKVPGPRPTARHAPGIGSSTRTAYPNQHQSRGPGERRAVGRGRS